MTKQSHNHWVLIGPAGRQAGRKDQHIVALKIVAIQLLASGAGGGIINSLIPKSIKELVNLKNLIDRGYTIKSVTPRPNLAKEVREAVMSDELMAKLAVRFELDKAENLQYMQAITRSFSEWICEQLTSDGNNDIKYLVKSAHPELANRTNPGWWKEQISERVRKLKT